MLNHYLQSQKQTQPILEEQFSLTFKIKMSLQSFSEKWLRKSQLEMVDILESLERDID